MFERILEVVAPHYCCSCDRVGKILCEYCKYDIVSERYEQCLVCKGITTDGEALCKQHILPYSRAWCVGERSEVLQVLINSYKFERTQYACRSLAELLAATLPELPADVTVVPVPTIAKHVRQRGYDHTRLLAREFARLRQLEYRQPIKRLTGTSQLGKGRRDRRTQAQQAFGCDPVASGVYLLIDDIFTTGSTIEFAAKALRGAGATEVWVAIIARQPLE